MADLIDHRLQENLQELKNTMSVMESRFEKLWKIVGHPDDNREYANDWFVNGWLSSQQLTEADRAEVEIEEEFQDMRTAEEIELNSFGPES